MKERVDTTESDGTPTIGDAQLEILDVLWELGEASLGEVVTAMNRKRSVSRTTVQTLLMRMVDKGLVRTTRSGRSYKYAPRQDRASTLQGLLRRFVDSVFKGSSEGLVLTLLDESYASDPSLATKIEEIARRHRGGRG